MEGMMKRKECRDVTVECIVMILDKYVEQMDDDRAAVAVADVLETAGKRVLETASVKVTLAQVGY
jgi:hypothetical protein